MSPETQEILMSHLNELESIAHPKVPVTEQSEAAKLKQSVGQLRDLTNKKKQVQAKVDSFKKKYKATLTELQDIQNEIEKVQKILKDSTDNYANCLKRWRMKQSSEPQDTLLGLPTCPCGMGPGSILPKPIFFGSPYKQHTSSTS